MAPPSAVPNAYPELPVLAYQPTGVGMPTVIARLNGLAFPVEVKRTAYIMFRNEGQNGHAGINFNWAGVQADGGRWPEELTHLFTGTVVLKENGTGKMRRFVAFADVDGCLAFLCDRVQRRELFIGGTPWKVLKSTMTIHTPTDLARAYTREWVVGSASAEPTSEGLEAFLSMYRQAQSFFGGPPS